jgi:hypothetical protein
MRNPFSSVSFRAFPRFKCLFQDDHFRPSHIHQVNGPNPDDLLRLAGIQSVIVAVSVMSPGSLRRLTVV